MCSSASGVTTPRVCDARSVTSTISLLACAKNDVTLDRIRVLVGQEQSESFTLEYKEKFSPNLVKSVAAMANTYGGLIVVGVTDQKQDDRIVGVDGGTADKIVNACFDSLEPPVNPEIIELALPGKVGRSVIVVRVHADRAPRPVLMGGSAPVRLHGRNALADRNRLRQLFDESPMPSRFSAPLPAPTLNSADPDRPKELVILRSGMRLPVGDAVAWRALSEQATQVLGQALDNSPITEAVGAWCAELGLPTPEPSRLAGHNRARRLRLVRSALADRHLVEVVTELQLPPTYGASGAELLFTLDISAGIAPEPLDLSVPLDPLDPFRALAARRRAPGTLPRPEDRWWLRLGVSRLRALLDAVLATLVDEAVVAALASLADIDTIMVPRPPSVAFRSAGNVEYLLGSTN